MKHYHVELLDFLDKSGGMELLLAIDVEKGTKHGEFQNSMSVSRQTVTDRIDDAKNLDLLEMTYHPGDHGNANRYKLSQIGRVLRVALDSMELDETYQTYIQAERELENGKDEFLEWVQYNSKFWSTKSFEIEFTLEDELKDPDTYPGEDIPSEFADYLVGEKPLYQKIREAKERHERGSNSGERDSSS